MDRDRASFWRSPAGLACAVFLAVAAFYLWTEHRAHTLGALPYLVILACPIMHLLMHHGHHGAGRGGHEGHDQHGEGGRP